MMPLSPVHSLWIALLSLLLPLLAWGSPPAVVPASAPTLRALTQGGCCTQPFWSADSRQVLFIDKPGASGPVGIWGVDVTQAGAVPTLYTTRLATYSQDMAYVVEARGAQSIVERVADGKRWSFPTGGRQLTLSPTVSQVAWQVSSRNQPREQRRSEIWVAPLAGRGRAVTTVTGGGLVGWLTEDLLLLSQRTGGPSQEQSYSAFSLSQGSQVELFRAARVRDLRLSPDGQWLAYTIALHEDRSLNGLWVVRTDGTQQRKLDRALYGAYQWRDGGRLLIIPFKLDAAQHELWEYAAASGASQRLTDPAQLPFKVANNDWQVSPDGKALVFVSAHDRNLWLLTLP